MHNFIFFVLSIIFISCGDVAVEQGQNTLGVVFEANELENISKREEAIISELCQDLISKDNAFKNNSIYKKGYFVFNGTKKACSDDSPKTLEGIAAKLSSLATIFNPLALENESYIFQEVYTSDKASFLCSLVESDDRFEVLNNEIAYYVLSSDNNSNIVKIFTAIKQDDGKYKTYMEETISISKHSRGSLIKGMVSNRSLKTSFGCSLNEYQKKETVFEQINI
ncbi:MAG: hypothetical protein N4A33_03195 [Bacteriovoracaceae bacterium]|jgi:hypothetical protein|nr:hypothetical protein [Bacteriovoracaceae bacterium]